MSEQDELSFEDALTRLEQIVEELDSGRLPLAQAIARFQEGAALRAACERKLTQARAVIEEYVAQAAPVEESAGQPSDGTLFPAQGTGDGQA